MFAFRIGSCQVQHYKYQTRDSDWIVIKFVKLWTIFVSTVQFYIVLNWGMSVSTEKNRTGEESVIWQRFSKNSVLLRICLENPLMFLNCCDQWKKCESFFYLSRKIDCWTNQRHLSFGINIQREAYDTSIAIDGCGWHVIQNKITE